MDDRKLLELAAKAAGLHWREWTPMLFRGETEPRTWPYDWNPATNNDDAFWLLVKCRMTLEVDTGHAIVRHPDLPGAITVAFKAIDMGEYEGSRLAITRGAAALGAAQCGT